MSLYQHLGTRATPALNTPSPRHRDAFARECVRDAFGSRAIPALDESDFRDRQPDHGPRHLGTVVPTVTHDTGQKTLRYWLNQAGRADTDDERQTALRIAGRIANLMGIDIDQTDPRAL